MSLSTFNRLLNEKSDKSPEMALKLSKVLGRLPDSWMRMQDNYDLYQAREVIDVQNYEAIQFAV